MKNDSQGSPAEAGWTQEMRARFLEKLGESSNVSAAARSIGRSTASAYALRHRDPAFAKDWAVALERGYCELEMLLLRKALKGVQRTETVTEEREKEEGSSGFRRVRTLREYPLQMAERLLIAHRRAVTEYRDRQGGDTPDRDQLRREIWSRIERTRRNMREREDEEGGDGRPDA